MAEEVTLADALREVLDSWLTDLHTALPGRVESYDPATQTADILPMIQRTREDEDGEPVAEDLPVLPNVPVAFPRSGSYFLSFPIQKGDFMLVVFCESAIDLWRSKGKKTHPGDLRRHSLTSAVAYPGLYPNGGKLADAHASNLVIGKDGGSQIHVKDNGEIHIGSEAAAEFVALAQKVATELSRLETDLNTLKTAISGAATAPMDGGATFKTNIVAALSAFPSSPGSVAASKTKAD